MSHAPTAALERRHARVRAELTAHNLDALVVTSLANVLYLTNFAGTAAIVVVTPGGLHFLTDSRYVTSIAETRGRPDQCPGLELELVEGAYDAALARLVGHLGAGRVGFEASHLTVARYEWLRRTLGDGAALVATEGIIERGRVVKDHYEIATLAEGARRLSRVAQQVFGDVARGMSERELALQIDRRIGEAGFSKPAFDTIVASGPNAALPHAHPGERILTEGDLVVLDFGGVYDSYCVDLTRTVAIGPVGSRERELYAAVLEAHDAAVRAVRPGASRFDIDQAARDSLSQHGLGEAFGHGTGHGLGIEVHEDPRISRRRPDVDARDERVETDMVFTIEPGAYMPGWAGVRIEDDVRVTSDGVEVLTDVTTELLEM
jgi:Xaa-Pro aminopeptidase